MVLVPAILTIGKLYTFTAKTASELDVQPSVFVPLTLYVVLIVGLIVIELKLLPVLHVYELAPFAVKLIVCPEHIAFVPVIVILGRLNTLTESVLVFKF